MKKYTVTGYANVVVKVTVEAENEEEAIKKAYDNVGIDNYCGNGGVDKLIGGCDTDEATASIYVVDELEYAEVEEVE
nr:MAG: RNA polymerase inhibitor [Bacteriophage sp.]